MARLPEDRSSQHATYADALMIGLDEVGMGSERT